MKKVLLGMAILVGSINTYAQDGKYSLEFTAWRMDGSSVETREKFNATDWLESFPNANDPREKISKSFEIKGELVATVSYYNGTSDPNSEFTSPGHRDFNIYDFSVKNADGSNACSYQSLYVKDLREMPYIHLTCVTGSGRLIGIDFSSAKFWKKQ